MAVDKLVDSAQLESDLTSVADAIRAKTGGTADLQFPADFVSEIGSISGGGFSYPWGGRVDTVTVGANSVTNMDAAKNYFSSYLPVFAIILKTAPTENNQVVEIGNSFYRYKGGTIQSTGGVASYDGRLIEGTQYDIYRM